MKPCLSLRTALGITLTVVAAAFHGAVVTAQTKPLSSVKQWAGKSPYFLWKTEPLHHRLTALLGAEYATFAANLGPATDLEDEHGILHLEGNAPHQGGEEEAVLIIDIPNDTIEVFLLHRNTVHAFAEHQRLVAIPTEVKERFKHWPAAPLVQALSTLKQEAHPNPANGSASGSAAFTPTPKICLPSTACEESNSFAATITDFRTSSSDRYKVVTATVRITNKLARSLTLGLVQDSGLAIDDQGNRYVIANASNVRGIGLIVSNTFDPKFTLQPGESSDARVELLWPIARNVIFGTSWELSLALREIDPAPNNQFRMGRENELHFSNLVNQLTSRQTSTGTTTNLQPASAQPGQPAQDFCAGAPRCYNTPVFTATISSMTATSVGNFKDHLLRIDVKFRNITNQPIILAYAATTSIAIDNLGNSYFWGHAGSHDTSVLGIGISESQKVDPRFVLQPGESRSAIFNVIRYRPGNAQLGTSFTFSTTIRQVEVLPSQQVRELRDFSLNYPNLTASGFSPSNVNDTIKKIGNIFKK